LKQWAHLTSSTLSEPRAVHRSAKAALTAADPSPDPTSGGVREPLLNGSDADLKAAEAGESGGQQKKKKNGAQGGRPRAGCCDAYFPATLAAILCLWVLKLTQQGYLDGLSIFTDPLYGARYAWDEGLRVGR
jgi:hypothetical protein